MSTEELKNTIISFFPDMAFPEINSSLLNIECKPSELIQVASKLKEELKFDFLFSLTALDWPEYLEIIYHLRSSENGNELVLRVKTEGREKPMIPSVYKIWSTAEFHEREVYDLFGVVFENHPDLRRIFLEDDWEGFPLRKDYVDDINIITL